MNRLKFIIIIVALVSFLVGCGSKEPVRFLGENAIITESGLEYIVMDEGHGPNANFGDEVVAHCVLKLGDSLDFWSTRENNEPYTFVYSKTGQIDGFIEAIGMMSEGSHYKVIIPPELGYGSEASGEMPPNSYLSFDIEILALNDLKLWIADSLFRTYQREGIEGLINQHGEFLNDSSGGSYLNEKQLVKLSQLLEDDGRLNDKFSLAKYRAKLYPDSFGAHYALARIYETRGDKKLMRSELQKCLQIDPDNEALMEKIDSSTLR